LLEALETSLENMRIFNINTYDINGGAARAAYRIHHALRSNDINSTMLVNFASSGDWTVSGASNQITQYAPRFRHIIGAATVKMLMHTSNTLHSLNYLPSKWPSIINKSNVDAVNLHWINHEMLSIKDIARITKPVVWTLHDMWAFCGAEHYTDNFRWRDGYKNSNKLASETGVDLNKWNWERKIKAWKKPMHIVAPSQWLADCAKNSVIMRDWPIHVIPNTLDTNTWQPIEKSIAREILNLPKDKQLVMFGALGGVKDERKGFDLLIEALNELRGEIDDLELVILGQLAPKEPHDLGFKTHYLGHLHDDYSLILLYSAVDCFILPSRQDNLPNTAVESLACGTPVISFNTCGLPDLIKHKSNGYLAKSFDTHDLATGIKWLLSDQELLQQISANARKFAVNNFSYASVGQLYKNVYQLAINNHGKL
jgi:glycosyltransferase involved in cell wall biosynthesis